MYYKRGRIYGVDGYLGMIIGEDGTVRSTTTRQTMERTDVW